MQIRIGNRQDEPAVRELVRQLIDEIGRPWATQENESDLQNMEAEYIGRDGIFLVAEEKEKVIGFAVARKLNDQICEIRRIVIAKEWRGHGLGKRLIKQIIEFARRLEYRYLDAIMDPRFKISQNLFDELDFQMISKSDAAVYRHQLSSC